MTRFWLTELPRLCQRLIYLRGGGNDKADDTFPESSGRLEERQMCRPRDLVGPAISCKVP